MHPSWRDLVIDGLAADGPARRRFLGRCGVHGAMLALSVAGGAVGERRLPLLLGDADWDALTDRVYALVPELTDAEMIALLTALGAAIDELGAGDPGREAVALARTTLVRAASCWDEHAVPIGLGSLDAWLALAGRLAPGPAPALPSLSATWAELLPARAPAPEDRVEVGRLTDWVELCRMLWDGPREVWDTLDFGAAHVHLIADFVDDVGRRQEVISGEHVSRALRAIAELLPDLSGRAHRLAGWIELDAGGGEWSASPPQEAPRPAPRSREAVDIQRVLADL